MDKPWKVISAFVGVFIAGAVFGGFFTLRNSSRRLGQELEAVRQAAQSAAVAPPAAIPAATPPQPVAVTVVTPSAAPVAPPTPAPAPVAMPQRPPISMALFRQFAQRLNLSNAQREKLRPILGRWGDDFQHLRQENERLQKQYLGDTVRLSERMYGDVGELLTPEQRTELEKMRRESEERVEREKQKRLEAQAKNKAPKGAVADPLRPLARPEKDKAKGKGDAGP